MIEIVTRPRKNIREKVVALSSLCADILRGDRALWDNRTLRCHLIFTARLCLPAKFLTAVFNWKSAVSQEFLRGLVTISFGETKRAAEIITCKTL